MRKKKSVFIFIVLIFGKLSLIRPKLQILHRRINNEYKIQTALSLATRSSTSGCQSELVKPSR